MSRFIEGCDRRQRLLLPDYLDDYVAEDSLDRVVDVFVDELDLFALGFEAAAATGRPGYHPATLLKLYVYGYLNWFKKGAVWVRSVRRDIGKLRASSFSTKSPNCRRSKQQSALPKSDDRSNYGRVSTNVLPSPGTIPDNR